MELFRKSLTGGKCVDTNSPLLIREPFTYAHLACTES